MPTLYTIFLSLIALVITEVICAIKIYKDGLDLNPELMSLEDIKREITIAEANLLMKEEELKNLHNDLLEAHRIISEAKSERQFLANHDQILQNAHKKIDDINEEIKNLADKLNKRDEELRTVNEEVTAAKKDLSEINTEIARVQAEKSTLEATTIHLRNEKKNLEIAIDQYNSKLNEIRKAIQNAENELNRIKNDIERHEKLKQETEELDNKVKELIGIKSALETEIKEYEGKKQGVENLRSDMWRDLDQEPDFSINLNTDKTRAIAEEKDFLARFKSDLKECNITFNDRAINAFHTGLKSETLSPLVVLSGISGTGKSLLPKLYAQASGMNFLTVPVQPRWDSPQDMLGFFNYMQDKYKATELSRLLWCMDIYNNATCKWKSKENLPMNIVLLDEMNLARIEYYFSDLLSKLEFRRMISNVKSKEERSVAEIEIECGVVGKEKVTRRLFVNDNTLFVGTMNEDETTQMLSDKVMDRSNIIRFGKPNKLQAAPDIEKFGNKYSDIPGYLTQKQWDSYKKNKPLAQQKSLEYTITELLNAMDNAGRPFAHRVWQSILTYVTMYPGNYQDALSDQIEMKILPKLNGLELDNNRKVSEALNKIENIISETKDQDLLAAYAKCKDPSNGTFFQWKGVVRS